MKLMIKFCLCICFQICFLWFPWELCFRCYFRQLFMYLALRKCKNYWVIDFTIKVNVKKQRRFDRSTVILKLKSENF